MVSESAGPGTLDPGASIVPMRTTWLRTCTPATWRSMARATAPRATRAAVSRALARSRTGRASSKPYFCIPTRSACPGRGRVRGALRARSAISSAGTGSADMIFSHFGHSELPTSMAMGAPRVCPCRTPPRIRTASASNFMRAPRPAPSRRRARSCPMSLLDTSTCAGIPSTIAVRACPCDSPAVSHRTMVEVCQVSGVALTCTSVRRALSRPIRSPQHRRGSHRGP